MAATRPNSPLYSAATHAYLRAVPPPSAASPASPADASVNSDEQNSLTHSSAQPFTHSSIERDAFSFAVQPNARDFEVMLNAFLWSGGIVRSPDAVRHLQERQGVPPVSLEPLLASRAVFAFDWAGSQWLPMFQFESTDMSVNSGVRRVMNELGGVFDGWALACWFLEPNLWLQQRRPLDLIEASPWTVAAAARGDRFIATNSLTPSH